MPLRTKYWIPSIIFLLSFCFHLSLISKGPVTIDCLSLVNNSQSTLATHQLHYMYGSGYPLMILLGSIFITIGKYIGITDPVLAVNFISVLFSSIAILVFYLLVQQICDTLTAFVASFILLLNPIFLDVSTYGINHAPALCFLLLGLLSLLHFQTTKNISNLLLSALYFGFLGATRLQDLILTFPAIGFMFVMGLKEKPSKADKHKTHHFLLFLMTIIAIITLFHLSYFIFDHSNYNIQAENNWKLHLAGGFKGLFSRYFITSLSYLIKAFNIFGIILFVAGLYYTAAFNKRLLIFTILWCIIPLSLLSNDITTSARFFNILLPAIIIPISILLAHMFKHKNMLWNLIVPISCILIFIQPLINTEKTFMRRHQRALISDFYLWVGTSTKPDTTIISLDDGDLVTYYSRRNTLIRPLAIVGHLLPQDLINFKKKLDNILNNKKTVYITEWTLNQYDRYQEFKEFMEENYRLIQVGQMPLELWYDTPFDPGMCSCGLIKIMQNDGSRKNNETSHMLNSSL